MANIPSNSNYVKGFIYLTFILFHSFNTYWCPADQIKDYWIKDRIKRKTTGRSMGGAYCEPNADAKEEEMDGGRHSLPLPGCPFHTGPRGKGRGTGIYRQAAEAWLKMVSLRFLLALTNHFLALHYNSPRHSSFTKWLCFISENVRVVWLIEKGWSY